MRLNQWQAVIIAILVVGGLLSSEAVSQTRDRTEAISFFRQVYAQWPLSCDDPLFTSRRLSFDVIVTPSGRLAGLPTVVSGDLTEDEAETLSRRETLAIQDYVQRARVAVMRAAPFAVPAGYEGGNYRVVFAPDRACAARR